MDAKVIPQYCLPNICRRQNYDMMNKLIFDVINEGIESKDKSQDVKLKNALWE